jgi:hypothetical protein
MDTDLLSVYRTLKRVCNQESDEVLKIHAQLALEELSESVKDFLPGRKKIPLQKTIYVTEPPPK